jgi:hypothetical protein
MALFPLWMDFEDWQTGNQRLLEGLPVPDCFQTSSKSPGRQVWSNYVVMVTDM